MNRQIELLEDKQSCITDGSRLIPKGTIMTESSSTLSWIYFKGDGFTYIVMGWDYSGIKRLN